VMGARLLARINLMRYISENLAQRMGDHPRSFRSVTKLVARLGGSPMNTNPKTPRSIADKFALVADPGQPAILGEVQRFVRELAVKLKGDCVASIISRRTILFWSPRARLRCIPVIEPNNNNPRHGGIYHRAARAS